MLYSIRRVYRWFLFLGAMASFQFIITFVLTVKISTFLRGATEKIQGRSLDLYNVVNQVNLKIVNKWNISGNQRVSQKSSQKYYSDYNRMLPRNIEKKSLKGVSKKVILKIYNFTETTLRCGCSVNLMHIFRTPLGDCFCLYYFV